MRITTLLFIALGLFIFLISCSKNDSSVPALTAMKFTNAYPGHTYDIYTNDNKLVSSLTYDSSTSYAYGEPKIYSIKINETGSSTDLVNGIQQLQSGVNYSMYLAPVVNIADSSLVSDAVSSVILNDNTTIPNIDTCKIRIIDLAPFTPIVNFVFSQDGRTARADTLWPSLNRYFNDQETYSSRTAFFQIPSGVWHVNYLKAIDSTVLISRSTLNFQSRGVYTIYLKGVANGQGGIYTVSSTIISQ
ncbi:DUF4397 domain-containing protein [Rhizosphaericola mali]|uniref:DUF4397 domain-containing protein n=1 Tax=Rhizosphaericola mali TaxID=2545455 RepID=A0A5P2G814_9BACT|nr:DUF4397 domain-containing protein [Rhizosphaericola mali]QES90429.1 DUF4397 domain-containing protein [Rhizosphaericola mali]